LAEAPFNGITRTGHTSHTMYVQGTKW